MVTTVGAGASHSPCKLLPPCKQGNHGSSTGPEGENAKPIGKYYFTEDALKHDLAALKRGELYERDEFYKRAKAWYKAEIDRLLHLERVKEEFTKSRMARNPANNTPEPITDASTEANTPSELPNTPRKDLTPPKAAAQTRTRIQPARAAKRKAAEPPPTKQPPRRKKNLKAPASTHASTPTQHGSLSASPPETETAAEAETQSDYALAAYDWAQFRNGNRGEHRPSPWSYVQLQGLDVAYFCMRLERAVAAKIDELVRMSQSQSVSVAHANNNNSPNSTFGSALEPQKTAPPFTPAAALSPGEDWRPPPRPPPLTNTKSDPYLQAKHHTKAPTDTITKNTPNNARAPGPGSLTPPKSWAADEVSRRMELQKRTGNRQVPEADMEISPTLGRWRGQSFGRGHSAGLRVPVREELGASVVEVSGLRFAVDFGMCRGAEGSGVVVRDGASDGGLGAEGWEGVRFLML